MLRALALRLTTIAAALLLAVVSVGSAARMAPQAADAPAVQLGWILNGIEPGALCSDTGAPQDHDHHCPFCRLLSDPPAIEIAPRELRLSLGPAWQPFTADQRLGPQRDGSAVSARGPPAFA